jgi:hypothetical protein
VIHKAHPAQSYCLQTYLLLATTARRGRGDVGDLEDSWAYPAQAIVLIGGVVDNNSEAAL